MKKIEDDIFKKLFLTVILVFFTFLLISFLLIWQFSVGFIEIYTLFGILILLSFALLFLLYRVLRETNKNILEDLNSLSKYLHNISVNKKYDSKLHIKHYLEFLHISIVLKNIVKRLRAKSKKK